jgi:16S rRNA pseudouridine516 synthase
VRLDKFLALATGLSRSHTHRLLRAGAVRLGEQICQSAAQPVLPEQAVYLDGEQLQLPQDGYWLFHKPAGYLCANQDGQHPTVLDKVCPPLPRQGLQIVGRLDLDTTGMLLLTTDGSWNHKVASPKSSCGKTYRVTLAEAISTEAIAQLQQGLLLRGEKKPTKPAQVQQLSPRQIDLCIFEGRYHQVKRMLAAVGNQVVSLHRLAIGPVALGDLPEGALRALSVQEVALLAGAQP